METYRFPSDKPSLPPKPSTTQLTKPQPPTLPPKPDSTNGIAVRTLVKEDSSWIRKSPSQERTINEITLPPSPATKPFVNDPSGVPSKPLPSPKPLVPQKPLTSSYKSQPLASPPPPIASKPLPEKREPLPRLDKSIPYNGIQACYDKMLKDLQMPDDDHRQIEDAVGIAASLSEKENKQTLAKCCDTIAGTLLRNASTQFRFAWAYAFGYSANEFEPTSERRQKLQQMALQGKQQGYCTLNISNEIDSFTGPSAAPLLKSVPVASPAPEPSPVSSSVTESEGRDLVDCILHRHVTKNSFNRFNDRRNHLKEAEELLEICQELFPSNSSLVTLQDKIALLRKRSPTAQDLKDLAGIYSNFSKVSTDDIVKWAFKLKAAEILMVEWKVVCPSPTHIPLVSAFVKDREGQRKATKERGVNKYDFVFRLRDGEQAGWVSPQMIWKWQDEIYGLRDYIGWFNKQLDDPSTDVGRREMNKYNPDEYKKWLKQRMEDIDQDWVEYGHDSRGQRYIRGCYFVRHYPERKLVKQYSCWTVQRGSDGRLQRVIERGMGSRGRASYGGPEAYPK